MATLFKEVSYTLEKLMHDIQMGEIGLPDIQRPFIWPKRKVRDLFDSMYKGFPVGFLLFWVSSGGDGYKQIGTNAKQKVPRLLIVDGQQRLTSLYAVLKGHKVVKSNYQKERIFIGFNPITEEFKVTSASTRRNPEYIPDISEIWSSETDIFELAEKYLGRLSKKREISKEEKRAIRKSINNLDNISTYPFTALEISSTATEEEVAEVFVRINSKGKTLRQADFILTLMSVFWDEGRKSMEEFSRLSRIPAKDGPSPFNYYIQPDPDQLLRSSVSLGFRRARLRHVYSILRGKDLETGEYSDERRVKQFGILRKAQDQVLNLQNWHEFLKVLKLAGFLSEKMISSKNALLYTYALFLIGKRDYGLDLYTLRNVIARWYFMVSLTGRYTGSPESAMGEDLARLRGIEEGASFVTLLDNIIQNNFTDDFWSINLPDDLETSSARSPSLYAYYAALNLLDARVLFSKMKASELMDPALVGTKSAIERHHLFPKGYLKEFGITGRRETNQIANYALVEWSDNITISDRSPADYFPEYARRFPEDELAQMMKWHALPVGWEDMEYPQFLAERRKLIAEVIREGFQKLV